MKALELLKECKELLLDVTIEKNGETAKAGILWLEKFDEAIAEIEEAMKPKTCEGCVYFRDDRRCWIENINKYLTCKRHIFGLTMVDRYEPKE